MAVVTLDHIGKRYDAGSPVLTDVSLTLEPGAFHFLTGARGAGKTTLLKIITLAERPSRGRLTLFGADSAALNRTAQAALRRRIGVVFQDAWLIARAIIAQPGLLIADEPAGHGGEETALLLVRLFERINSLGTTVLIASDDIAFAGRFAHRRFHLDHGMLVDPDAAAVQ